MAITHGAATGLGAAPRPEVRRIGHADLNAALREGWRDFLAKRGDLIFIGLLYPMIGLVAAVVATSGPLLHLLFPLAAGLSLLGPLVAIGFYELARRREQGLESDWSHFLDVRKRPGFGGIMAVAMVLILLFVGWMVAAAALYAALIGPAPVSVGDLATRLFATPEGWSLILIGNVVGFLFAAAVLAVSVVSLPMLVDRDVDAGTAISTSIAAVRRNPGEMARWGLTVAALLVAGSLPLFIGLAVVLPWLGYATWHLYTKLIDRSEIAIRG